MPYVASLGYPDGFGGLLLAALPVGILLGNLVVGRALRPHARERFAFPLALLVGAALLPMVLRLPLWAASIAFALAAAGLSYELGIQRTFIDAIPEHRRGQAFGLLATGLMTGQGLGALILGSLAEATGPGLAIALGGLLALAAAAGLYRPLHPSGPPTPQPGSVDPASQPR